MWKNGNVFILTDPEHNPMISEHWQIIRSSNKLNQDYDVAFLIAPDIVMPPQAGHAIASLMTAIINGLERKCIVFCNGTTSTIKQSDGSKGYDLAVYRKGFSKRIWDGSWFFRGIKSRLITPIKLAWREYAAACADACIRLKVKCLVVEDVADFVWVCRKVRRHGIKVVLHQHAFTQRNYNGYLWRSIDRNIDKIVFVSKTTLNKSIEKFGKLNAPATVIYNGVNLEEYRVDFNDETRSGFADKNRIFRLLFVGRLSASKGILDLVQTIKRMDSQKLELTIVAATTPVDIPTKKQFDAMIADIDKLINPARVLFDLSPSDVIEEYRRTDAVIIPSIGSEGLPKVVTEALAMGVPIIASDRGGTWELVEDGKTGWLIPNPVGVETITETLRRALETTDEELAEMKKRILAYDRPKMDEMIMIRQFSQLIEELIGEQLS